GQVRTTVLGALENDGLPFPLLVERLQPVRDPSRSPLFQAMFAWEKTMRLPGGGSLSAFALGERGGRLEIGRLTVESTPLEQPIAQFDLTLLMAEADGDLLATVEYNTDLFDAGTIRRLLGHLQTLLQSIVDDPTQRIGELQLLLPQEKR